MKDASVKKRAYKLVSHVRMQSFRLRVSLRPARLLPGCDDSVVGRFTRADTRHVVFKKRQRYLGRARVNRITNSERAAAVSGHLCMLVHK
ncbi:hypothetical protein EVAR_73779_1 [Eumeta japonica]|uniref:Uncharacterized protein n=1 Tax=Eumeta variegata TaxID=151549 RepID=A0A4C1ZXR3_EUMVA|nr:hypothetical protein EVAR_73779_1 [Eumeta japonica]